MIAQRLENRAVVVLVIKLYFFAVRTIFFSDLFENPLDCMPLTIFAFVGGFPFKFAIFCTVCSVNPFLSIASLTGAVRFFAVI